MSTPEEPALRRRLGTADAVTIGLGSMIGAGIFVALAPAAEAAGSGLLIGLAIAAVVAYCNAISSARLAALYPQSGGTYVYGRERLGEFWGYAAGWSFVVGKTASCAAMALTVGIYAWPAHAHVVAVAAVVALTAVNYAGIEKSALLTRVIVAVVLAVLAAVVVIVFGAGDVDGSRLFGVDAGVVGVLQAAGLLFFAFAGYARIATLGEEVRTPARTIPRAIPIALGITLVVYAIVAVAVLGVLGSAGLAASSAPLADAVRAAGHSGLEPVIRVGAAVAALGSLLSLILGVSRTTLAMARDRHLPHALADGASALRQPPPRRAGRGCRRGGGRRGCRRARGDRLLVVRRSGLLRDRQRLGYDSGAGRPATSSPGAQDDSRCRPGGLRAAGRSAADHLGPDRRRRGASGRARVLVAAKIVPCDPADLETRSTPEPTRTSSSPPTSG